MKSANHRSLLGFSVAAIFGAALVGAAKAADAPPSDPSSQSAAPSAGRDGLLKVAANGGFRDGAYVGSVVDAYYGDVQVRARISGGRLVAIEALQYPADRRTSRSINAEALPLLESEAISAQSARVDIVSGATLTSDAYLRSLKTALAEAGSSP
jgi:uncharacterized protein with FMN-binding domain